MHKLIGLYSPAPQSGKSTVAGVLASNGYQTVPFALTLKEMLVPMLCALGYHQDEAWRLVTVEKEYKLPEVGVTVRHMMQTLGTEYGRQCIHPAVWLTCWRKRAQLHEMVVADDCRFKNEADLIRQLGGEIWCVIRPDVRLEAKHASEGGLDEYEFDRYIINDGPLSQLTGRVQAALQIE